MREKCRILFLLMFCLGWSGLAIAQVGSSSDIESIFRNELSGLVHSGVVFSSSRVASGGRVKITSSDSLEKSISVLRAPVIFELGEYRPGIFPYLSLIAGYVQNDLRSGDSVSPNQDKGRYRTSSASVGAGARMHVGGGFYVIPQLDLGYNFLDQKQQFNTERLRAIQGDLRRSITDWNAQALTVAPSLELRYVKKIGEAGSVTVGSAVDWLWSDVFASSSELVNSFNPTSLLVANRIEPELTLPVCLFDDNRLTVRGLVSRTELNDSVRRGLDVRSFWEFGGKVLVGLGDNRYLKGVGIGVYRLLDDDLNGWRIGLELE
jgi:hypothetical protein